MCPHWHDFCLGCHSTVPTGAVGCLQTKTDSGWILNLKIERGDHIRTETTRKKGEEKKKGEKNKKKKEEKPGDTIFHRISELRWTCLFLIS